MEDVFRELSVFSYILDDSWVSNSVLKLFTDSARGVSKGCGIYFDSKWVCLNLTSEWEHGNILKDFIYLELIPIALSVNPWGNQWHGKTILFHSDNQSVVEILNCAHQNQRGL